MSQDDFQIDGKKVDNSKGNWVCKVIVVKLCPVKRYKKECK